MKTRALLWTLNGKVPEPCLDTLRWGKVFETADRRVARDVLGDVVVSTVFIGVDYSPDDGPPILFETMVFAGEDSTDREMRRYATWDEAEAGHREIVESWRARLATAAPARSGSAPPRPRARRYRSS